MKHRQDYYDYVLQGKRDDYLKVHELKEGYLYHIHARNASFGIWRPKDYSFVIRRTKFREVYTFGEVHYDVSEDFGTAKPFKELEQSPFNENDLTSRRMLHENIKVEYWGKPKEDEILAYLENRVTFWSPRL